MKIPIDRVHFDKKGFGFFALLLICLGGSIFLWRLNTMGDYFSFFIFRFFSILLILNFILMVLDCFPRLKVTRYLLEIFGKALHVFQEFFNIYEYIKNVVIVVAGIFIFQIAIYLGLNYLFKINIPEKVYSYLSFLLTLILLAYIDKIVPKLSIKFSILLSVENPQKLYKKTKDTISKINYRKIAYIIGFLIYFVSVLDKFYGKSIISWDFWNKYKEVSLEGLLSFIALDSCILVVVPKMIENQKKDI